MGQSGRAVFPNAGPPGVVLAKTRRCLLKPAWHTTTIVRAYPVESQGMTHNEIRCGNPEI
jgi:hypothetical protein